MLFELSNSSAEEFIQNIGYGYASGFLLTHNIPVPARFSEAELRLRSRVADLLRRYFLLGRFERACRFVSVEVEEVRACVRRVVDVLIGVAERLLL